MASRYDWARLDPTGRATPGNTPESGNTDDMRLVASLIAAATATLLSGCITIVVPPGGATPVPSETLEIPLEPGPALSSDCGGQPVVLDNTSLSYVLTGDCPSVTVQGQDIEATVPDVATLTLAGDRLHVEATSVESLTIGGNDNVVGGTTFGSVQLNGDRNTVDASGEVGAVSVGGNDNTVAAASVGSIADSGARNLIGARP